jgi:type II secretory pathway pseudopilin PulG
MNRANKFFTLVEVILAVSMFVIGITAVLGVYQTSARALREARRELELVELLKQVAGQIDLFAAEGRTPANGQQRGVIEGRAVQYSWELTVGDGPLPQLRQVDVTVARTDDDAELSLSTYIPVLEQEDRTP